MNEPESWEERTILAALEELERDQPFEGPRTISRATPEGADGSPATAETLRRLYTEVLGLLPYELEPIEPRPEIRDRLMAAIAARATGEAARPDGADASGAAVLPMAASGPPEPAAAPAAGVARWWRPFGSIAAVLALLAAGLAGLFFSQLQEAEHRVARLDQERRALVARLDDREEDLAALATLELEVGRLGEAVTVMSTPGVEICPLRPAGEDPLQPDAFAVLFMAPGRSEWYLRASNLDRPPEGRVYKVWFYTSRGAIDGGVLDAQGQTELRFATEHLDEQMMLSVSVTLEPAPDAEAPTGPMVLFGQDKMQVL